MLKFVTSFAFIYLFIFKVDFIYFRLCWVFTAVCRLFSSCSEWDCSLSCSAGLLIAVGIAALRNSLVIYRLSVTMFESLCDLVLTSDSLDVFRDLIDEMCGKEPGEFTSIAVRKGLCYLGTLATFVLLCQLSFQTPK